MTLTRKKIQIYISFYRKTSLFIHTVTLLLLEHINQLSPGIKYWYLINTATKHGWYDKFIQGMKTIHFHSIFSMNKLELMNMIVRNIEL